MKNFVAKFVVTCAGLVLMFIPSMVGFAIYNWIDPSNFWERFGVIVALFMGLGGFQIWFLIMLGLAIVTFVTD